MNPGHDKKDISFYEPTGCGPLYLNDGVVMVDPVTGEETEPSNSLSVASCVDQLQGDCIDGDVDGWTVDCGDCNDGDASINPGAVEICDDAGNVDEDCDGLANADDPDCVVI